MSRSVSLSQARSSLLTVRQLAMDWRMSWACSAEPQRSLPRGEVSFHGTPVANREGTIRPSGGAPASRQEPGEPLRDVHPPGRCVRRGRHGVDPEVPMSNPPADADRSAPEAGGATRHNLFDDAQALVTGTLFVALGLQLFRQAGLMTGGTAGIALATHYAAGWHFGVVFFVINLPFYWLAWRRMGRRFTVKTFVAVALLSVLSEQLPRLLVIGQVQPLFAAIAGGLLVGAGSAWTSRSCWRRRRGSMRSACCCRWSAPLR